MHNLIITLLWLAATTAAQVVSTTQIVVQSPSFNLVVLSHNRTLNGSYLAACHEGAAIESLCALPKPQTIDADSYDFQLNTTAYVCTYANGTTSPCNPTGTTPNPAIGQPGILTWNEHFTEGNNIPGSVSQSMQLVNQGASSNAAFAIIFFAETGLEVTQVAFGSDGLLNMQDTLDTRKPGQAPDEGTPKAYYRWYMCTNYYEYYSWNHLMWVYGSGDPWDPSCEEVKILRVFV